MNSETKTVHVTDGTNSLFPGTIELCRSYAGLDLFITWRCDEVDALRSARLGVGGSAGKSLDHAHAIALRDALIELYPLTPETA
jgi:hypothetical protein